MSNKLFQGIIHQMKDAVDRVIGAIDENGIIVSCSELSKIGESRQRIRDEIAYSSENLVTGGWTYRPIGNWSRANHIVFVEGEDRTADKMSIILAVSFGNIKNLYDEKHDKVSFIKSVILDNVLPSDIQIKSRELHFAQNAERLVFLIKFNGKPDVSPFEIIQNMFPDKNKDYVISLDEYDVVLVRETKNPVEQREAEKIAKSIFDTLGSEFFARVLIGIGTSASTMKELSRSYKEAKIALEVGKIFEIEKSVISYENLGIGRLVYQLPSTLCEIFLGEVFKRGPIESLDHESLTTIQSFFENNLNVSETSRKLFVHRNTFVYRLDKIRKLTGLDLREFEDAITFKVALMVKRYLTAKPTKF